MFAIVGLILSLAFCLALTIGIAFLLDIMASSASWKTRAVWAALIAAFIPMSLPIISILMETGFTSEAVVPVAALVVGALFIAAVVCFPAAYFFSRKRAAGRAGPVSEKVFD